MSYSGSKNLEKRKEVYCLGSVLQVTGSKKLEKRKEVYCLR